VLVLVVIAVVVSLVAPSLRGFFTSRQAADSAQTALSATKWAHWQAISQGQPCRLNVDAQSGAFWLTVQQAGNYVAPSDDMGRRFTVPEGATISLRSEAPDPNVTYVQFYPSGRSDVATITIADDRGRAFQITCPSATEAFKIISPSEAH